MILGQEKVGGGWAESGPRDRGARNQTSVRGSQGGRMWLS